MKLFIIIQLLVISFSYADFDLYSISNLNMNYAHPSGTATVVSIYSPTFNLNEENTAYEADIVFKQGKYEFIFKKPNLKWDDIPSLNKYYDKAEIKEFNWAQADKTLRVSMKLFSTYIEEAESNVSLKVENFSGNCLENFTGGPFTNKEKIYLSCTKDGTFKFSSLEKTEVKTDPKALADSVYEKFIRKIKNIKEKKRSNMSSQKFENLDAAIINNKARISIALSELGGTKIVIKGTTRYLMGRKQIQLTVDSAKMSFFSVKNKFFDALEETQINMIKVDRPNIYIDFSDGANKGPGIDF